MINIKNILTETKLDLQKYKSISYNKNKKLFTVEISSIKNALKYHRSMKDSITLYNSRTLNSVEFKFEKIIYSGSGEDREIGGWEYLSENNIKLIIWND